MKYKVILLLMVLSIGFTGCQSKVSNSNISEIYGYEATDEKEILVENDKLKLHFDTETTQFYVRDKGTGAIWYSNPQDVMDDPLADKSIKDALLSTLSIEYSTAAGVTTTLNNYTYSIKNSLYTYEKLDNGIKVSYSIGNIEKTYSIPPAAPESRFKAFYDLMERGEQKKLDQYYRRIDINSLRATDNKTELLQKYPDLEEERVYVLRDNTQEYLKANIEKMFEKVGYTYEDYEEDVNRYNTSFKSEKPVFNVSIIYELDGDNLLVSIPIEEISYKKEYPITKIKPLAYFGAGGDKEDGFIIVPDGSGGLINFNNGKNTQSAYINSVYGWDNSLKRTALIDENRAVFPVFGISKNNASFLCLLEEGDAYADIEADVSGRLHTYNYAAASYTLIHGEVLDISAKSDKTVKVYQESLPKGVITQRYHFIDSPSYVDMAIGYREYLMDRYPQLTKLGNSKVPLTVEIVGAIDRVKQKFGVPISVSEPLTTYKEAKTMTKELLDAGFDNMDVKYNGWFNKGVEHKIPSKIKLISELGSKKDFIEMVEYIESQNIDFYVEADFLSMRHNSLWDDFYTNRDSAKFINRELVKLTPFNPIHFGESNYLDSYYIAKPDYYLRLIEKFSNNLSKLKVNNIAFNGIGTHLNSDYNPKDTTHRQEVVKLQQDKVAQIREKGTKVMIRTGNSYMLPYVDSIVDMKLDSKGFIIIDEEIPFYPIALHGLIPYAGEAVNLAGNYEKNILKTLETGAGLYFVFMDEPVATLQETNYTRYFAADYSKWVDSGSELNSKIKKDLGHTYNLFIVDHKKVDEKVYLTEYEDGTQVIVNYNATPYKYKGSEISGLNYRVERGIDR